MSSVLFRSARRGVSRAAALAAAGGARSFATEAASSGGSKAPYYVLGAVGVGGALYYGKQQGWLDSFLGAPPAVSTVGGAQPKKPFVPDYGAVKAAIADILDADEYDDGSYGPVLIRLAWHASGTYDKESGTGGSNSATMRFAPESEHGANAGLKVARDLLEPVKAKFPWISYSDLWTLGGVVAVEEMGGPEVPWRPGRTDKADGSFCTPDGRLPDASQGAKHIRDIFYRMGFDDQEIVALSGAHTFGRCHGDRSGYVNPWTNAPTTFSNLYFQELVNNKWRKKKWDGPLQYEDPTGELMMLPTDMELIWDKKFKKFTQDYAKDADKFADDFAKAFSKLLELGVPLPASNAAAAASPKASA